MSADEIIKQLKDSCILDNNCYEVDCLYEKDLEAIRSLLDLYQQEKEKNKELEKQYKILEVEKVRYNIQYLESNISQTPDTAMVYHSMKRCLETLKEEKTKLEKELQELLEERN